MMTLIRYLLTALSISLLAACASTDDTKVSQYLLPYPVSVSEYAPQPENGGTYRLKSISVPSYLQKQNIVLVNNDGQVYQASNHLWAESVESQLEHITLTYLASRLPNIQWVAPSQYQITSPYFTISLDKFYTSQAGIVTVSGYWSLWSADNQLLHQKRFSYSGKMAKDGYLSMTETLATIWFNSVIDDLITTSFTPSSK